MINKLKTYAIAILAAGATVGAANAAKVVYTGTNVIQPVNITLTVYGEGKTETTAGALKSVDVLTPIEKALTTTNTFDKKAELVLLTTSLVVQTGTTNVVTNVVGSVSSTLTLSTNVITVADTNGATNLVIGSAGGDNVVISPTNVAVVTASVVGGVLTYTTNNYGTANVSVSDNTVVVGTNAGVAVADMNVSGPTSSLDTNQITLIAITNGVPVHGGTNSYNLGTNSVSVSTATNGAVTVTLGTNVYTNGTGTNFEVLFGTNVVVGVSNAPGLGATNALSTIATTTLSNMVSGTVTNLVAVTTITDYTTNSVPVTNTLPVYGTNSSSEFAIADNGVNTAIPTNILAVTPKSTNDLVTTVKTSTTGYDVQGLLLTATNSSAYLTLKLQGLVKSTSATVTLAKDNVVTITNATWSDVSGYGTNGTADIVGGGTITIGPGTKQLVP